MRKIILYIATSLNGKIARKDGDVKWLDEVPHVEGEDYGYHDFYASVDTTLQGYATYAQIISWGIDFPYADKENFVLTRKQGLEPTEHVTFISENHVDFIQNLKQQPGKDIWLIGGGQVNTLLLKAGLIDELWTHTMPVILPDGIDLFGGEPPETSLILFESKSYSSGVVEKKYKL